MSDEQPVPGDLPDSTARLRAIPFPDALPPAIDDRGLLRMAQIPYLVGSRPMA